MHKILRDFEIQIDCQIKAKRPELVLIRVQKEPVT